MRLVDLQRIHDGDDVVAEHILGVLVGILRHVGRRVAALAVGDAAVRAGKVPHLRLPGAVVGRVFVHEYNRRAAAGFLDVEFGAVGCGDVRHLGFRWRER